MAFVLRVRYLLIDLIELFLQGADARICIGKFCLRIEQLQANVRAAGAQTVQDTRFHSGFGLCFGLWRDETVIGSDSLLKSHHARIAVRKSEPQIGKLLFQRLFLLR